MNDLEKLKYPIGKFSKPSSISSSDVHQWIKEIILLPKELGEIVRKLSDEQLQTPYRPEGWTVQQVVHHVADSHMNAYIRTKLALTEDNPTIKPYLEDRWAQLPDSQETPVLFSIQLIQALHYRWAVILTSLKFDDFKKTFFHPESKRTITVAELVGIYAWHGKHHMAHVCLVSDKK